MRRKAVSRTVIALIAIIVVILGAVVAYFVLLQPTRPTAEESVRIALIAPMSGMEAWIGLGSVRAGRMAAEEIKTVTLPDGRALPFEVFIYDDADKPSETVTVSRRAIFTDKVHAGILATSSETCLAGVGVWDEQGLPVIVAWAGHPDITISKWAFRLSPTATVIGKGMGYFVVNEFKPKKIAYMLCEDPYEIEVYNGFKGVVQGTPGVEIVAESIVEWGEEEYTPWLTATFAAHPDLDVLVVPNDPMMGGPATVQARALGWKGPLIGYSGCVSAEFFAIADAPPDYPAESDENIYYHSYADIFSPSAMSFTEKYREAYGVEPPFSAWPTYDSVYLLAKMIEERGLEPANILAGLNELRDWEAPTLGPLARFTERGEVVLGVVICTIDTTTHTHKLKTIVTEPEIITP